MQYFNENNYYIRIVWYYFDMESVSANSPDACFATAMLLLQSPKPEATDQLKAMLNESLDQQKTLSSSEPKQPATRPLKVPVLIPIPSMTAALPGDSDRPSLGCVICKRFEQALGNEFIECQECHGLYHQKCHKPCLTNQNVKDPRLVWYCSTCNSRLKKTKLLAKVSALQSGDIVINKSYKFEESSEMSPFKSWSFLDK